MTDERHAAEPTEGREEHDARSESSPGWLTDPGSKTQPAEGGVDEVEEDTPDSED